MENSWPGNSPRKQQSLRAFDLQRNRSAWDRDWEELKAEWEGPNGYGSDAFDLEGHLSKRADRTIHLQRKPELTSLPG